MGRDRLREASFARECLLGRPRSRRRATSNRRGRQFERSAHIHTRGGSRNYGLVKRTRLAVARPLVHRFKARCRGIASERPRRGRLARHPSRRCPRYLLTGSTSIASSSRDVREPTCSPNFRNPGETACLSARRRTCGREAHRAPAGGDRRLGWHRTLCRSWGWPRTARSERRAVALGIADRVAFLGRKEHIGDYLQILGVFVLPYSAGRGLRNAAAVEAMGMGIPTVVFARWRGAHGTRGRLPNGPSRRRYQQLSRTRFGLLLGVPLCESAWWQRPGARPGHLLGWNRWSMAPTPLCTEQ